MSKPRQILEGSTYLITRRCTQRQFLLRPSEEVNQIVGYCFAYAAQQSGIALNLLCVLSNHYHIVATDKEGNIPKFIHLANLLISRAMNAHLGRWENFWSNEKTSLVRLEAPEDVIDKIVYTATNPVSGNLVRRSDKWPGLITAPEDWLKKARCIKRPTGFFRQSGQMPEFVELNMVYPGILEEKDLKKTIRCVRQAIDEKEQKLRQESARDGRGYLGAHRILKQCPTDIPKTHAPKDELNPRIAASNKWLRMEAIQRCKAFYAAYREAYERWKSGQRDTEFPAGTYALRVIAGVNCASC